MGLAYAHWDQVQALLQMQGANGATVFTDSSLSARAVTTVGDAKISTATKRVAAAVSSGLFDGAGDYLKLTAAIGAGDFCVEAFALWDPTTSANSAVFGMAGGGATNWEIYRRPASGNALVFFNNNGGGNQMVGPTAITTGVWHHIAFYRQAGRLAIALDGVVQGSMVNTVSTIDLGTATNLWVGTYPSQDEFMKGNMSEFRVTVGNSVYPMITFTPPTTLLGPGGKVSGVVRDASGALAARTVRGYDRATGELLYGVTSDASTGAYSIWTPNPTDEVQVVCLDDVAGTVENDLILRATPA